MRTKVLSEMAKTLGIRVQQLDIFEGGYVPQGHVDIEREQVAIRRLLSEIADGKRSLPIEIRAGDLPQGPPEKRRDRTNYIACATLMMRRRPSAASAASTCSIREV